MSYIYLLLSSFLAATLVPLGSEGHLGYLINPENFWTVILVATLGNSLGSVFTYLIGWWAKWNWIEKLLRIEKKKIDNLAFKIQKYGAWIGLLCWLPIVGDLFAVALGIFRVKPKLTILFMTIGKFFRYLIVGYFVLYTIK